MSSRRDAQGPGLARGWSLRTGIDDDGKRGLGQDEEEIEEGGPSFPCSDKADSEFHVTDTWPSARLRCLPTHGSVRRTYRRKGKQYLCPEQQLISTASYKPGALDVRKSYRT